MLIEILSQNGWLMFVLSFLATILVGLLGWIGISVDNRLKDLAKSINNFQMMFGSLKGKNALLEADIDIIDSKLEDHEQRIRNVEKTQDKCKTCNDNNK